MTTVVASPTEHLITTYRCGLLGGDEPIKQASQVLAKDHLAEEYGAVAILAHDRRRLIAAAIRPANAISGERWPPAVSPAAQALCTSLSAASREVAVLHVLFGFDVEAVAEVLGVDAQVAAAAIARLERETTLIVGWEWATAVSTLRNALRPVSADDLPAGGILSGRYWLVGKIGQGGYGEVYRAREVQLPAHEIAVKILRRGKTELDLAARETQAMASIFWHPNVVTLVAHGFWDGQRFLVMPLLRGVTLAQYLACHPAGLSRVEARRIFEPLADALSALHRTGRAHRDLKPENIFLVATGAGDGKISVIIDLGNAGLSHEALTGWTIPYVAPESAHTAAASTVSDVFQLALCLRQALAPDAPLFSIDPTTATHQGLLQDRAKHGVPASDDRRLKDLRGELDRWLAIDPARRPTAAAFRDELAALTRSAERALQRRTVTGMGILSAVLMFCAVGTVARHAQGKIMDARFDVVREARNARTLAGRLGDLGGALARAEAQEARRAMEASASERSREGLQRALGEAENRNRAALRLARELRNLIDSVTNDKDHERNDRLLAEQALAQEHAARIATTAERDHEHVERSRAEEALQNARGESSERLRLLTAATEQLAATREDQEREHAAREDEREIARATAARVAGELSTCERALRESHHRAPREETPTTAAPETTPTVGSDLTT